MGFRDRVRSLLGGGTPETVENGIVRSGMDSSAPLGPGAPISPYDGYSRVPRTHDYSAGYNIAARPRRHERVAFDTLRGIVKAYDIAQIAIWHRIDSVRSVDYKLVAMPGYVGDVSEAVALAQKVLRKPDRETPFRSWLAKWLFDVLAYDAGCLYRMRNLGGRAIGLRVVDGTTIAPLQDYWGNRPTGDAPAFVQYAQGVPWNWLLDSDLVYVPFRPSSESPYGQAPIESILLGANTDLRFQAYFLQRFTEGNVPEGFATAPESWSPTQVRDWQETWDAVMYGDEARKHQIRWVPHDTTFAWSNEKEFSDAFSMFLMRKTFAAFHVVPADAGFTENVNKSSGDSQQEVAARVGDAPLMQMVEAVLTDFLQEDLELPLVFEFDKGEEQDDRLLQAQADELYINSGVVSPSRVAEMRYGIPEPGGRTVPRFVMTSRGGPVPLSAIFAASGPVESETGAPTAELPEGTFVPIEGVIPQAPPPPAALAAAASQDATADAPALVVKEATAGISVETGVHGDPLAAGSDEEDEQLDTQTVAKERAQFARFTKARRRAGQWRDFHFTALDPVTAHRLNDGGRASVLKAAGQTIAAGLAVRAADTGRLLMLQRALDPDDPACGTWEFPGGHIEDGETALQAGCREWQEETGCLLPHGLPVDGQWAAGVYEGFVITIPSEASIAVRSAACVTNPDDPDGDQVEAIAWWDPRDLEGMPALRAELAAALPLVHDALGLVPVVKAGGADPKARPAPSRIPHEDRIAARHIDAVRSAIAAIYPGAADLIRDAAGGLVVKAADPSLPSDAAAAAAVAEVRRRLQAVRDNAALEQALRELTAESYATGTHLAAVEVGGLVLGPFATLDASIDWSRWEPGWTEAALKVEDGGLAAALAQAEITVKGIGDTLLDRIGNAVGAGLRVGATVDTIATDIAGLVDDTARARLISVTETARAMTAASVATYVSNGLDQVELLLAPDACDECNDVADGNPYPVDAPPDVPIHPNCRCAVSPVITTTGTADTPDSTNLEE